MNTARQRWALVLGLVVMTVPACRRESEPAPLVIDARDKAAPTPAVAPVPSAGPAATALPASAAAQPATTAAQPAAIAAQPAATVMQPAATASPAAAATPPAATAPPPAATVIQPAAGVAPAAAAHPDPAAPPAAAAAATAADSGEYATVEISGAIELPPGAQPKERLVVFIAAGDCLNETAPLLRRLPVTDNRAFFAAVMVPQGSTLSLCAAAESAPGQPAHLYGRAGTLPIKKAADQTFRDVTITLREDSPRRFATQIVR